MAGAKRERSTEAERGTVGSGVMGIDYGRKRIGLAVADEIGGMPRPLATIERKNRRDDMRRLREVVREHGVKHIVVGHPLRLDGTHGEMAVEVERFAERLRRQVGVPVELMDERLTSWEAEQVLEEKKEFTQRTQRTHRGSARKRRETTKSVDAVAAAVILREYLERRKTQEQP